MKIKNLKRSVELSLQRSEILEAVRKINEKDRRDFYVHQCLYPIVKDALLTAFGEAIRSIDQEIETL